MLKYSFLAILGLLSSLLGKLHYNPLYQSPYHLSESSLFCVTHTKTYNSISELKKPCFDPIWSLTFLTYSCVKRIYALYTHKKHPILAVYKLSLFTHRLAILRTHPSIMRVFVYIYYLQYRNYLISAIYGCIWALYELSLFMRKLLYGPILTLYIGICMRIYPHF